jgi:hypothetical protein
MKITLKQAARDAIAVQNACNASGVIHSLLEAIQAIREANPGISTREVNTHPIVVLFVSKLQSLCGHECLCSACLDAYSVANERCEAILRAGDAPMTAMEWFRQIDFGQ